MNSTEIIELIQEQKADFIKKNGYAPDLIIFNSICETYKGGYILGMRIDTSPYIDINGCLMLMEIDIFRINL